MNNLSLIRSLITCGLLLSAHAEAMLQVPKVFGERYKTVPSVVQELTQVVYYREKADNTGQGPANVYIDGRYHTSLLPGGFTSFCLKPGEHALGAFTDDPLYRGKSEGRFVATLQGGHTYFLRVDESQQITQPPKAVQRQQGESEMSHARRQIHAHSRATSVVTCVYDHAASQRQSHYVLTTTQLFKQESGIEVLSESGMAALNDLVVTVRQNHPLLHSVVMRITGPEGQAVRQARARAIQNALMLAAIPERVISTQFVSCDEHCSVDSQRVEILVR
ncbi:OOP family OmpA-OmpF porin [Kluyvera sp. 1366]